MAEPLNIVIVEDSEADRFFLSRTIEKLATGTRVKSFDYADNALSYLKTADRPAIQIIFADLNMPRMGGFEFADKFQDLYPELKPRTQLWIMSHSIDPKDRKCASSHPAVAGFLSKTYDKTEIQRILELAEGA